MNLKEWLKNSEIGEDIWHKKYQHENETLDEWFFRVSGGNSEVEDLIRERKFLFGGRILASRGLPMRTTYSNCYVLAPPEDNIESIFDTARDMARTFSYGGGVGIDLGKLRPKDMTVNNAAKTTSGPTSFMDLYSQVTATIGQSGRRGALMISFPIDHPDVKEFIQMKSDLNKVTKANISVRVSNDFMHAVERDEDFHLYFRTEHGKQLVETVNARELFHLFCKMNWDYAEPGLLFWDNITNWNLMSEDEDFEYAGTNPCGEEPLPAGGSCLLGAINLAEFVEDGVFDFFEFKRAVFIGVGALNEVLDEGIERQPLQIQKDAARDLRQIGLGIFGLADCLIKMRIRYGSDQAIQFVDKMGRTLATQAIQASSYLARIDGSFPNFNKDAVNDSHFYREHFNKEITELRNSQLLTVAPTGTISTMFGVSGGIEPIFANSYTRKTESLHGEDKYYKIYTPIVQEYFEENQLPQKESLLPDWFITAEQVPVLERIAMQGALQYHIDASISSTINLPNSATVEDIENLYLAAWRAGLKGVTVYRDGCARSGILTTSEPPKSESAESQDFDLRGLRRGELVQSTDNMIGKKKTLHTGCGTLHLTAFFDAETGDLRETFFNKGSLGGCNNFMVSLSRMVSLAARGGVGIYDIVDQLNSSGACPSYAVRASKEKVSPGSSCPVAIGKALLELHEQFIENSEEFPVYDSSISFNKEFDDEWTSNNNNLYCENCGSELIMEGGCSICKNCGESKCD